MHAAMDSYPSLPKLSQSCTYPFRVTRILTTLNAKFLEGCTVFPDDASDGHDITSLLTMWIYPYDCLVLGKHM